MTGNPSKPGIGRILVFFAFMAALLLVVSAACGDDDAENDLEPFLTRQAANGDGDDGELSELTGEYEKFEGYVKYTASGFPESDLLKSMAIYQEGDRSRIDVDSEEGLITLIDTPDASYVCSEATQCLEYPAGESGGAGGLFTALINPSTIEDTFGSADYELSEEEIAGIDATCFTTGGNQVCFAEGGLLLRVTFADAEGGTLEAVEAGSDIPGDAFDPPYDIIDLSDFGQ